MKRGIAHRAQDRPDLAEGLALTAQYDGLFPELIELLFCTYIRILEHDADIFGGHAGQPGALGAFGRSGLSFTWLVRSK
jgi:hypothetical protein